MIKVVYLGVSASAPSRGRGLPAIAVVVDGHVYLFDVGEGTQARLQEAGLSIHRVRAIFVTHLHGDHFFGLPGLLQFAALSDRREALTIVGPAGLEEFIAVADRVTRHVRPFGLVYRRVSSGVVYSDERVVVEAFRVCHYGEAYGYKIYTKPKLKLRLDKLRELGLKPGPFLSRLKRGEAVEVGGLTLRPEDLFEAKPPEAIVVYTGDTRPCITTIEAARRADLLIHDATFSHRDAREALEKRHSTAREAALVARLAGVSCLALFHISARYGRVEHLVEEARSVGLECVYAAEPLETHVLVP